jgi:hypothetical protein
MKDFSASFLELLDKVGHFLATKFFPAKNYLLGPVFSYLCRKCDHLATVLWIPVIF